LSFRNFEKEKTSEMFRAFPPPKEKLISLFEKSVLEGVPDITEIILIDLKIPVTMELLLMMRGHQTDKKKNVEYINRKLGIKKRKRN